MEALVRRLSPKSRRQSMPRGFIDGPSISFVRQAVFWKLLDKGWVLLKDPLGGPLGGGGRTRTFGS